MEREDYQLDQERKDYLERKISYLRKELLDLNNFTELSLLLSELLDDLCTVDDSLYKLIKIFFDYIDHIKCLGENIESYKNSNQLFGYKPERADNLKELQNLLLELIPFKKLVYEEIKYRQKKGEKSRNTQLFIEKFNKGHGIHDLENAKKYWSEEFFKLPLTFKEKTREYFSSKFLPEIKKNTKLLVFKTISLPIEIPGRIGAIICLVSPEYKIEDWLNRERWYDKFK